MQAATVNLNEYLAMLLRRWLVLAMAGMCTLVGLALVHDRVISYEGCSTVVLKPPAAEEPNVLVNMNPSVAVTTGIAVARISSPAMQAKLASMGVPPGYQITQQNTGTPEVPAYAEPLLQICQDALTPQAVDESIVKITAVFRTTLVQLQESEHVRSEAQVTAEVVVPVSALPITGRPSQAYLGVLLIGLCGGLAAARWTDPWFERRRAERTGTNSRAIWRPWSAAELRTRAATGVRPLLSSRRDHPTTKDDAARAD
jgi:hypothetical protein